MRVGVIYRKIAVTPAGPAGGGDVFTLYLLRALKELGHEVTLATAAPTDWDAIERSWGWAPRPDLEMRSEIVELDRLRLCRQFLPSPCIELLKRKCDLTFNAYGWPHNLLWDVDFSYMHTPLTKDDLLAKYGHPFTRLYFRACFGALRSIIPKLKTMILTNSEFSRSIIRETLGAPKIKILHPPIDTSLHRPLVNQELRNDWVISVGRFAPEKRFELVASVASLVPEGIFHIVGSTPLGRLSQAIIKSVQKEASELGVKGRVKLHIDAPFSKRLEILALSKVYLHLRPDEYFGMTLVEAMSAGLVPIVPAAGGPSEIVPSAEFTYKTLEEAAEKVRYWLREWAPDVARELSEHADRFGYDRFKRELDSLIRSASA